MYNSKSLFQKNEIIKNVGGLKQTVQHFNNLHFLLILEHYILAVF